MKTLKTGQKHQFVTASCRACHPTALLQSCFAGGAAHYPAADEWAKTAAPFLLKITAADNGRQLTVPIHEALD